MYRLPAIAVFLAAAAFPPSLKAQMRSAPRPNFPTRISAGPSFRAVQPSRGGLRIVSPRSFGQRRLFVRPAFRRDLRVHIFFGNSCFASTFFDPFFCQQFLFPNRFLFAQPVFVPYPVYTAPSYQQVAEQTSSAVTDRYGDLAGEVERVTSEIEQLRQEQALREQARQVPPQPSPSVEGNTPTILVFRDGHRSEVRNYAIVGKTLWAFTEQRARKIPLSDLDVEATRKVNADRGVEVRFP